LLRLSTCLNVAIAISVSLVGALLTGILLIAYFFGRFKRKLPLTSYGSFDPEQLEFPREKLRIEEEIGKGYFGAVYRAQAYGITGTKQWATVAIKTIECTVPQHHRALPRI
jgi:hypothetical protein